MIESFATSNPYGNRERKKQRFECNSETANQTVHIRLDQERGFETEKGYDNLTVSWDGYYKKIDGTIESLPNELKGDWYDTDSAYLQMQFESDHVEVKKGFKFDILCIDSSKTDQTATQQLNKRVEITNAGKIDDFFAREISCLTLSDHIQYRLLTDKKLTNEADKYAEAVESFIILDYGNTKRWVNSSNSDWIGTKNRDLLIIYDPNNSGLGPVYDNVDSTRFDYYDEEGNFDPGTMSEVPKDKLATFHIEVRCEVKGELASVSDISKK